MANINHAKETPQANHSEAARSLLAATPCALGQKVEIDPKAYVRKRKHPEDIKDETDLQLNLSRFDAL